MSDQKTRIANCFSSEVLSGKKCCLFFFLSLCSNEYKFYIMSFLPLQGEGRHLGQNDPKSMGEVGSWDGR